MQIQQNVSLKAYSTMRLGGAAAYLAELERREDIPEAVAWAEERNLPLIVIGGGSNIIWRDEGFPGLVLVNKIMGYEERQEDDENVYITVGAGENWDAVVERTVAKNLTGIEALSLVPGSAGATPMQNVGAYGQDVSQTLLSVEAFDLQTKQLTNIQNIDCGFGYRTSRFKTSDRGRFIITAVTFHLLRGNPQPPYYASVQAYFDEHGIAGSQVTPRAMRDAVIAIRTAKLPDPAVVANNGSFFPNAVVDESLLTDLQATYGDVPHTPLGDGKVKLYSAWLVEQAGFKDFHDPETGMATWPKQALVLVNESAESSKQLEAFTKKITDAVNEKFHVQLEQEPELLPKSL